MALVNIEIKDKIAWLTFNRPEKLNAWNSAMREEFAAGLASLKRDDDVSVLVLRGAGRAFSVGQDVTGEREYVNGRRRTLDDWLGLQDLVDFWLDVWRFPKPTIASIHGYCMGIATGIAVCSDITIIAEDATVGWPSVPLGGGLLGPASEWLIGPKKAKELSYVVGSKMTGVEAQEWGWANYAVPAADVEDRTRRLANRIAKTPLELLKVKKAALNRVMDIQGFTEALKFGAEFDAIAHDSNSVDETAAELKQYGLRETIARFVSEEPAS
jgi:enoyl-CoA hydratase